MLVGIDANGGLNIRKPFRIILKKYIQLPKNVKLAIILLLIVTLVFFSYFIFELDRLAGQVKSEEKDRFEYMNQDASYKEGNITIYLGENEIPEEDKEKLKDLLIAKYGPQMDQINISNITKSDNNTIDININNYKFSIAIINSSMAELKIYIMNDKNFSLEFFDVEEEDGKRYINYTNTKSVRVGVYLDHIKEFNLKDSIWRANFFIWFAWLDSEFSNKPPNETYVLKNIYVDNDNIRRIPYVSGSYALYEIKDAEIVDNFDPRLYPMDNQFLTIRIEEEFDNKTRYDADPLNMKNKSSMSDRTNLAGYKIHSCNGTVRNAVYETNFGNYKNQTKRTQYNFIIYMIRENKVILFFKVFLGLISAVFVSIMALFIKADEVSPRFGLGIGSLFAAIANNYVASSALPVAGIVTLIGLIHGAGIVLIFLTMIQSIISLYICNNLYKYSCSKWFDVIFLNIFLLIPSGILIILCINLVENTWVKSIIEIFSIMLYIVFLILSWKYLNGRLGQMQTR
jgi:hypothetical protein